MKKLILLIPLLWFVSCVQEDMPKESQPTPDAVGQSSIRSIEEALSIAEDAVTFTSDAKSRISKRIKKSGVKVLTTKNSRSSNTDTLLYVVDLEDEQGFVVIAANRAVEPIMAVTEKGSFDSPEVQSNEGFQSFMAAANNYVSNDTFNLRPEFNRLIHKYVDTIYDVVRTSPVVKVKWGQDWPENMFAKNNHAGCVAVAIAQMMSAFEFPSQISYNFEGCDISRERLLWPAIKLHRSANLGYNPSVSEKEDHIESCPANAGTHTTIGRLLAQVAKDAYSVYLDEETTSNYANALKCIKNTFRIIKS